MQPVMARTSAADEGPSVGTLVVLALCWVALLVPALANDAWVRALAPSYDHLGAAPAPRGLAALGPALAGVMTAVAVR